MLDLSDMRRGLKHVTLLKRLQGQRKPLTDIVAATVREGAVEKLPFKQLEPEFFVYQRFSHVSVNPNVEDDTRFLCSAYTFESDATEFNPQLQKYVNLGPQYAHNFVNQLIDAATIHQMVSTDQEMVGRGAINLNTQRCFVLVGEKGTGKTFFLNHVLSKYTDYLDARNTIWVRLNLVSSRGFDDLTHWIHAQIAKIILRYYDGGSEFISKPKDKTHDFYGHLQGWVKSQPVSSELKLDLESRLFEMYQVFCKKGSERHINPQISHKNICVELYRYCREALGLAFIIVLDGYDQLDIDQYHVQRFESLDSQVKQLFETYEPAGCVFLIVCRNRTFDAIRSSNPYRNFQSNRRFEVKYVSIKKIFEKRIHCIIQEIAGFISGGDRSQFGRRDWKAILTEFEQNLLTNGTLDYLDKALQTNNRSKMQMIQAEFKTHLQKETHQAYKLIEHMVRAGFTYPPLFYEYYVKGDQIISTKLAEAQYESRFLPIITRPPVPLKEDGSPDVRFYSTNSVLHGVRLLQLAISGTEAHSRNKEVSLVTIGEMCRILAGLFDYNSDITRLYIKELESYELLRILNVTGVEIGSDFAAVQALPKANFLIDECISDAAYLNLCAMRTLIPRDPDVLQFFRAAQLGSGTQSEVQRWIVAKLINSVSMMSLCLEISEAQRLRYEKHGMAQLSVGREREIVGRSIHEGLFSLFNNLAVTVRDEFANIIRASEQNPVIDSKAIVRSLSSYLAETQS